MHAFRGVRTTFDPAPDHLCSKTWVNEVYKLCNIMLVLRSGPTQKLKPQNVKGTMPFT